MKKKILLKKIWLVFLKIRLQGIKSRKWSSQYDKHPLPSSEHFYQFGVYVLLVNCKKYFYVIYIALWTF